MGERFHFVAPRDKTYLPYSGRFYELLFDGTASKLVGLIAVPVPVKRQNVASVSKAVASGSAERRGGRSTVETATGASVQLIWPGKNQKRKATGEVTKGNAQRHKLAKTKSSDGEGEANAKRSITLSTLPVEMQRKILDNVEDLEDLISLGLANRHFWGLAQEYIDELDLTFYGKWAGKNIVCVGEDVNPGDYPEGLYSQAEVDELGALTVESLTDRGESIGQFLIPSPARNPSDPEPLVSLLPSFMPILMEYFSQTPIEPELETKPFTLFHLSSPSVSVKQEVIETTRAKSVDAHTTCKRRDRSLDPAFKYTRQDVLARNGIYFPEDERWILRNLTTKEFVRSEGIALRPEYIHGPNIDVLGFGDVLLSRICWSSLPRATAHTTKVVRGAWAGHRFDIRTLSSHLRETNAAEWRDASAESAAHIGEFWEEIMGSNWREEICAEFTSVRRFPGWFARWRI